MRFFRFISVLFFASLITLFLNFRLYGDLSSDGAWDRMGYAFGSIIILSWLLSSPIVGSLWNNFKLFGGWLALLILIIGLYSFRSEFGQIKNRIMAAVIPQMGYEKEPGTMSFYRSSNGHFHIEALVNGRTVRFLVDTGASDIVIAPHLAKSLGYHLQSSDFTKVYHTANGTVSVSPISFSSFLFCGLSLILLPALVYFAPIITSFLCMRFFTRLAGYQVKDEILTLTW